ncbi:hypothetical protein FN846DRAFT_908175 [Sphaerosporella brunnea]|uniref:Rhodopsin domain-containing protein n=1 Tax=Sphaerosporella brunnea TaxID=1250544 RepID=A0A5J5EU94_9PEZI|nr:hypothetical protein FN846DRAFT_908175 [Sphaerosporella brunnea]
MGEIDYSKDNGDNNIQQVIGWYICTFVPVIFLGLRFWIRIKRFGKLLLDDYLLMVAWSGMVVDLGIQHNMWKNGMGNPHATFHDILIPAGSSVYIISLWMVKLSLAVFYRRVASRTKLQTLYNILIAFLIATLCAVVGAIVFACFPVSRKYTTDPKKKCPPSVDQGLYWLMVLTNIFTDTLILALPWSIIATLRMPLRQKLGLGGVFALGIIVIIASIVRAVLSHRNETMLTCTVSMAETAIAIIATCLPAIRTLVMRDPSTFARSGEGLQPSGPSEDYELRRAKMKNKNGVSTNDSDEELVLGGTAATKD